MDALLARIGLAHLAPRFRKEDIDDGLFWSLGEAELKELGLTLGQRKKLLKARAELSDEGLDTGALDGLEMRRLTVLFIDMIGSTSLAARLSPDDMHELLQSFYFAVSAVVRRFGGYVASTQGDGMILLFGYPRTRVGDAARALDAALAVRDAEAVRTHPLSSGAEVAVGFRIGAATGPAIVGRPHGAVVREGLHMVGQVLNRAARLQTASQPGGVMVDAETRAECGDHFRFEDSPDTVLKGIEDTAGVARLLGRGLHGAPERATGGKAILGRAAESARLLELLTQAEAGQPQIAVLTGEAGVGKTSLVRDVVTAIAARGAQVRRLSCSALIENRAFGPVIELFAGLIGDRGEASDAARRDALRHLLGARGAADQALVARLLGLGEGETGKQTAPAAFRDRLIALLADLLLETRDAAPLLIVVEDLHWCDATTRELLETCAAKAEGRRVMLLATSRDVAEPLWAGRAERDSIALSELAPEDAAALLNIQLGGLRPPDAIRQRLLSLSEGNPLMLETLARSFRGGHGASIDGEVAVPRTIYESVAERLDALGPGRSVAAALSVLDGAAERDLIAEVLDQDPEAVEAGLEELRDAGLVADTRDGKRCRLYHHLYRDVVYERLVGATRRNLHRRALDALRDLHPEVEERQPDLLAHHAIAAGAPKDAASLALRAGEWFLTQSALIEAGHYLEKALTAVGQLPETDANQRLRLQILTDLASVKRGRFGIASKEVGELGREILTLSRAVGDARSELLALNGLYSHALVGADYRAAFDWANALAEASKLGQDRTFAMIGRRALGVVAMHTSRLDEAEESLRAALAAYDVERHLPLAYAHGYDQAEICAVFLSLTLWMRGDPVEARKVSQFSVTHSREIDHAHSLAQALAFQALLAALAREGGEMAEAGIEAAELGDRYDMTVMSGAGRFFACAARLLSRAAPPTGDDLAELQAAHAGFLAVNPYNYGALSGSFLAEAALKAGRIDEAEAALERAGTVQAQTGEDWVAPELLRLRAKAREAAGARDAATRLRREALAAAEASGAVTLALRTACDMAESVPSEEASARLRELAGRMRALDAGWDARRLRTLGGGA